MGLTKSHSRLRTIGPVLAAAFLTTACGPRDSPAPAQESRPAVLMRGLGAEPDTLDPQLAEDNAALALAVDLYEGLTISQPDGSTAPGAAESWKVTADGLTYDFHLRRDLRWSNGDELTAQQFAAALNSLTAQASTAPNASLFDALDEAVAIDERELRIRLSRPVPHLPALLALPVAGPRHPGSRGDPAPLGNGAFRLAQRTVGERIVLERNPHYWNAEGVALDGVEYLTVADLGTELNLYRTGEIDVTSEVPNTHVAALRKELPGELRITPYLSVYSYAVNLARLPDRDARRALALTVDRERITRQVTGAGEIPAFGWIPDGIAGYAPARFEWRALPYTDAVGRARADWAAARSRGAVPGTLTICTDASANHHRTAVALADLWRSALGVETRIVELEWTVYLDTRRAPGDCDLIRLGWSADFLDPEAFATVFESTHPQNTLGYRSARYDALLEQARTASSPGERMTFIASAEALLLADIAVIPIFFRVSKRLVKPHVAGVQANPLGQLASRDLALQPH